VRRGLVGLAVAALLGAGGVASADEVTWRPCRYEDGSGQRRCVWDARHMGNGEGQSFKVRRGGTDCAVYKRISHRRAHELLGW
jgi:hypothetical protein